MIKKTIKIPIYFGELTIIQTDELIKPRSNILGQMKDYKMVKITMEFSFDDNQFLKTSTYKIPEPGHVWK